MAIYRNQQSIILKPNGLASEKECCCQIECTATGGTSGGDGVTTDTYPFPLSKQEIYFTWQAYYVPDKFTVSACGTQLFSTGEQVSGGGAVCLEKPEGCGEIQIVVEGGGGTAWDYFFDCKCPPPPPPTPCCYLYTTCEGTPIYVCGGTERRCCNDTYPDSDCSVENPPIIECDPDANAVATIPDRRPFDCLGRTHLNYLFGAWVTISGWSYYDYSGTLPGDFSEETQAVIAAAESIINGSHFVEWDGCFAEGSTTFTFGGAELTVTLFMCERSVQFSITDFPSGFAVGDFVYLGPAGAGLLSAECNSFSGCYCSTFQANFAASGGGTNGTVQVGVST